MSLLKILKEKQTRPVTAKVFSEQLGRVIANLSPDALVEIQGMMMSEGSYVVAGDGMVRIFVSPLIKP